MGILHWIFGGSSTPDEGEQTYTIAPGYEDYVHNLPATGDGGDYGGAVADALINAGILVPANVDTGWWDSDGYYHSS